MKQMVLLASLMVAPALATVDYGSVSAIVTHDVALVEELADTIATMSPEDLGILRAFADVAIGDLQREIDAKKSEHYNRLFSSAVLTFMSLPTAYICQRLSNSIISKLFADANPWGKLLRISLTAATAYLFIDQIVKATKNIQHYDLTLQELEQRYADAQRIRIILYSLK